MNRKTRIVPIASPLVFVLALACASVANADPIPVTSGVAEISGTLGGFMGMSDESEFHLSGPGFTVGGGSMVDVQALFRLATVPVVKPGSTVDWSGVLRFGTKMGASFGTEAGPILAPFEMSFAASPARVAGCHNAEGGTSCTATAPFTFETAFTFVPMFGGPDEPIAGTPELHQLTGRGTAHSTVLLESNGDVFADIRYVFGSPIPTPEPATLPLVVVGVIGAAALLRGRQSPAHAIE